MPTIAADFDADQLILPAPGRAEKRIFDEDNYERLVVEGLPSLREVYRSYLYERGINAESRELLITSGLEQGMATIEQGLFSKRSNLLFGVPSIYTSISKFKNTGINMVGIPMDEEGIIPEELAKHSKKFDKSFLYLEPVATEPAGVCMSRRRRMEIAEIIEHTTMPVIENDQKRQFWAGSKDCPTFKKLFPDKAIYIDASLKVLFPYVQIACIVASELIISRLTDIKMQQEYYTSSINQLLAEELFLSGQLNDFFVHIRTELEKRKEQTDRILHFYLRHEVDWKKPQAGIFFWLRFKNINTFHLCNRLRANPEIKVCTVPGSVFESNDIRH